jgi:plasmid stabilization system protein ParE
MPENKLYRFDPQAWLELEAAGDWYRLHNAEASVRFLAAVYDALEAIAQSPQRWPKYVFGTRRFVLYRFPFSIVYLDEPTVVSIVAIAHSKRKPGYWEERLER